MISTLAQLTSIILINDRIVLDPPIINGGASRLSTESVETTLVYFGEIS
jgi:hypothetical protein